jgi:hypothetical protein
MSQAFALSAIVGTPAAKGQFKDVSHWAAFDPGDHEVGTEPIGYLGAVFDGRYVYFAPFSRGGSQGPHGEVLRYDASGEFLNESSWATYDPGSHGVGQDPDGYAGAVYDGRYVYFVPFYDGTTYHSEVLRYDTMADFLHFSSWITFDPSLHDVGDDMGGYIGGVYDGRYVYFAPARMDGGWDHGEVLRYDTHGAFTDPAVWETFDAGDHDIGNDPDGYQGAAFDGRYVYFSPAFNGSTAHDEVLRLDTAGDFTDPSSWNTFEPSANGVESMLGYRGALFDGRYVYFVPAHDDIADHGRVLRYDTFGVFSEASSWDAYDAGDNGVGDVPDGYQDAAFDGRYVYFGPRRNETGCHGEVLRYDTLSTFTDPSSWATYNPGHFEIGSNPVGYNGVVFDGRFVYFVPGYDVPLFHGEVLRYDTLVDCNHNGIHDDCDLACGPTGGRCDVPGCGLSSDENDNSVPDECEPPIPTVSEWGLTVMAVLVIASGALICIRRRSVHEHRN